MTAGVPPLGASCGMSKVAGQVPTLPLLGSSEYMVPPLLAVKRRGPSRRNCGADGGADCQNRRVTLIDPDTVDWLFPPSLTVTDQASELSPFGAEADARFAEMV